ncbi:ABC-2 transporter permease [Terribacillus sp. DMT04]|uniref:ABC-2 transporter permease n=1 Tax=Terribacillus sp. DMT04 TaxID=2850441 RepID=UPI001C2C7900|nr:ABC-2 transporter permease [Terribacillus sp. DMT04]QXE00627.1 ABC-2 transporter permease [Terribacillus sp. DMT04]
MFNLIRRDVILQKWGLFVLIPFILFFIIMKAHPIIIFLIASIYIPFNTYAYDEKTETNILLNSLPYTRNEIIASRYLGAVIYMVIATGITSAALYVFHKPFTMTHIVISTSLFLLFVAISFPLFYIFKQGHISSVLMFSFILTTILISRIASNYHQYLTTVIDFLANISVPILYTGTALAILVVYGTSWGITTFIYQRKAL